MVSKIGYILNIPRYLSSDDDISDDEGDENFEAGHYTPKEDGGVVLCNSVCFPKDGAKKDKLIQKVFKEAYKVFMRIARSIEPEKYVGIGWNTSQTKVIDNAIIGYCLSNKIH